MGTICLQLGHIALGGRVCPHFTVHGGRQHQGNLLQGSGQAHQTEQLIGLAMNEFGHEIGTGGGNQDEIGFSAQIDVRHVVALTGIPLRGVNSLSGQGLHGDRGDELSSRLGHHHLDLRTRLDQRTTQLRRLETGDATGES